jgi:putative hemolysin
MVSLITVIVVSLVVSFVCSILEAVLLSLTPSYIAVLEERGEGASALLARLRSRIDEPIAAILTLNTIAHTVGAALGGALALQVWGNEWVALFSALLTLAILVLSEILPKTIGAAYWQSLAVPSAYLLRAMIIVLKPLLVPLALISRLFTPKGAPLPTVSREELEVLAEIGRREGALEEEEWQVVANVMGLGEVRASEVMTPRTQVVSVPVEAGVDGAKAAMLEEGHLRLPVYEGTIDNVVGILLARDLWRADRNGETDLRAIMRPAKFVPESKAVEALIREMRRERIKMAIVVDEFGGTAGLVTLEDLIEEIVGEIQDEHEVELPDFEEVDDGECRIAGGAPVWEVNERFELRLPEDLYDTIGGYIFGQLGRVARVGDEVDVIGGRFRVLAMDGRRIDRVAFYSQVMLVEAES